MSILHTNCTVSYFMSGGFRHFWVKLMQLFTFTFLIGSNNFITFSNLSSVNFWYFSTTMTKQFVLNLFYFILGLVQYSTDCRISTYKYVFLFSDWHDLKRAVLKGYKYPNYLAISLIRLLDYNICLSQTPCSWNLAIWVPPS